MNNSNQATTAIVNANPLFDSSLTTIAKALYMLLEKLTDTQGILQCSQEYLAKTLSMSRRSVIRHIAKLESAGYVQVKRDEVNSKIPNIYKINKPDTEVSEHHETAPQDTDGVAQHQDDVSNSHGSALKNQNNVSEGHHNNAAESGFKGENSADVPDSHTDIVCLSSTAPPPGESLKTDKHVLYDAATQQDKDSDGFLAHETHKKHETQKPTKRLLYDPVAFRDKDGNCILDDEPYELDELPELEGMTQGTVIWLVEKYGFSVVAAVIEYAKEQINLTNPPGFVIRVLQGHIPMNLTDEIKEIRCRNNSSLMYLTGKYAKFLNS